MIYGGQYANVETRFNDWVQQSGRQITNLALDYINRALVDLWQEDDWEYCTKRAVLTVTSKTASLPSDFGKILAIYKDSNNEGKADTYYYKDGLVGNGYTINPTFSKSTGFAFTITFSGDISDIPSIYYKSKLEEFAGTGTEYTFFPENLLLLKSQLINLAEVGTTANEYQVIEREYLKALNAYRRDTQNVNAMQLAQAIKDSYGRDIILESMDLTGEVNLTPYISRSKDIRE